MRQVLTNHGELLKREIGLLKELKQKQNQCKKGRRELKSKTVIRLRESHVIGIPCDWVSSRDMTLLKGFKEVYSFRSSSADN